MGGLVDYFSRGWRGSTSESAQDLVGTQSQSNDISETSITNPDFINAGEFRSSETDSKKSPVKSNSPPSELATLPPDLPSPADDDTTDPPSTYHKPTAMITSHLDGDDDERETKGDAPVVDEVDYHDEPLSPSDDGLFVERVVQFVPLEEGERYQDINSIAVAIVNLYKPMVQRKATIKQSLNDFKKRLGAKSSHTSFSECFTTLRARVSSDKRVELVCAGTEPLKLKIEDITPGQSAATELDDDVKQSVMSLNTALGFCQKYKGEKELKLADIQYKLDDLQLMPLTREGQSLYNAVNDIPQYLEEMSTDIDRLHQQLYEARHKLRPN